jgi:hypothetical protein
MVISASIAAPFTNGSALIAASFSALAAIVRPLIWGNCFLTCPSALSLASCALVALPLRTTLMPTWPELVADANDGEVGAAGSVVSSLQAASSRRLPAASVSKREFIEASTGGMRQPRHDNRLHGRRACAAGGDDVDRYYRPLLC